MQCALTVCEKSDSNVVQDLRFEVLTHGNLAKVILLQRRVAGTPADVLVAGASQAVLGCLVALH